MISGFYSFRLLHYAISLFLVDRVYFQEMSVLFEITHIDTQESEQKRDETLEMMMQAHMCV